MSEKNPWQTLSKQNRYESNWIRTEEHEVLNPAGKPGVYSVTHFKNIAVAVIPLDENNNTWIVGQYRYPVNSFEWEVCEGGCPVGTEPIETAKRELLEECGLIANNYELILQMQLSNSATDEISFTFLATGITVTKNSPEETEQLTIKKIPFDELYEMVMRGEIKDALSVASVLKVKALSSHQSNR